MYACPPSKKTTHLAGLKSTSKPGFSGSSLKLFQYRLVISFCFLLISFNFPISLSGEGEGKRGKKRRKSQSQTFQTQEKSWKRKWSLFCTWIESQSSDLSLYWTWNDFGILYLFLFLLSDEVIFSWSKHVCMKFGFLEKKKLFFFSILFGCFANFPWKVWILFVIIYFCFCLCVCSVILTGVGFF